MHPNWKRRLAFFPILIFLGVGLCLNNTLAVVRAFTHRPTPFGRTPKPGSNPTSDIPFTKLYTLPRNWTSWGELALAGYALGAFLLALDRLPIIAPALSLITLSFAFVGGMGLWQGRKLRSGENSSQSVPIVYPQFDISTDVGND
jgi:hypothetical protein